MPADTVRARVNPLVLRWARQSMNYRIEDISRSTGVPPDVVEQWEHGDEMPTFRQLRLLANKVKRPLAALFLPEPPQEPPLPRDFRRLPGPDLGRFQPDTILAIRKARRIMEQASELAEALNEELPDPIPSVSLRDSVEQIAYEARLDLGVSVEEQMEWPSERKALQYWRDALSRKGVLALQVSMPREDARGFSLTGRRFSVIAVTSREEEPYVSRIFSLFHEYAHLCLRRPGVSNRGELEEEEGHGPRARVEAYCNRFAAAFLVPSADRAVADKLKTTSLLCRNALKVGQEDQCDRAIRETAHWFRVSKDVLLLRLKELGLLNPRLYEAVRTRWDEEYHRRARKKSGGPRRPDVTCLTERGRHFVSMVLAALDSGYLTMGDARDYLSVPAHYLGSVRERLASHGSYE